MWAHFDTAEEIADVKRLVCSLNSIVGRDIAVYSVVRVADDAHARFDATSRTYKYFIGKRKSPFDYHFSWTPPYVLDVEAMNEAASRLFDYSDFTSFSKLHTDAKTNICRTTMPVGRMRARGWCLQSPPTAFCATWCAPSSGLLSMWGAERLP